MICPFCGNPLSLPTGHTADGVLPTPCPNHMAKKDQYVLHKRIQCIFCHYNTCGGYPCFFFAAMDSEAARMLYGLQPSAMQKRCKITRCVYKKKPSKDTVKKKKA